MNWTFGQKIAAGFATVLVLTVLLSVVSAFTVRNIVAEKDRLLTDYTATMLLVEKLNTSAAEAMAFTRGYLLTATEEQLTNVRLSREEFAAASLQLQPQLVGEDRALIDRIDQARREHWAAADAVMQGRRAGVPGDATARRFDREVAPAATALRQALEGASQRLAQRMEASRRETSEGANRAVTLMIGLAGLAVLLGAGVASWLTGLVTRQIGEATTHLQSSSTELQAAASQQAAGSGEQAAAMNEVSTTMKELLSTSRQIAQSAQRVAAIADETASSADQGDQAVAKALEAIQTIQRQVEQIVHHMLELGKRTQQIGAVLEIIKELAEQTNILSINATIEAAGAGENGKRFGAVAEEIRKLADRVGNSAGEVRSLIEEIRAAANTTVMVTEDGSKAVEQGTRQFGELASTFHRIVSQVGTTAEAAREIELSTKQQASAVEQVNLAIADAAQAAKETEASSRQTLQTSSQLAAVSRALSSLAVRQARA